MKARKILSLVLALVTIFSCIGFNAFALDATIYGDGSLSSDVIFASSNSVVNYDYYRTECIYTSGTLEDTGLKTAFKNYSDTSGEFSCVEIVGIKLYSVLQNVSCSTTWQVYLAEVGSDITEVTSFTSLDNATLVYEGTLSVSDYVMFIPFNKVSNFLYRDGNSNIRLIIRNTTKHSGENFKLKSVQSDKRSTYTGRKDLNYNGMSGNYYVRIPQTTFVVKAENSYDLTGASSVEAGGVSFKTSDSVTGGLAANVIAEKEQTVTVSAKEVAGYTAVLSAKDSDGNDVVISADNTFVMPEKDVTVTATYTAIDYTLTAESDNAAAGITFKKGDEEVTTANVGDEITVTAKEMNGWKTVISSPDATITDGKFTMPAKNVTVNVTYTFPSYYLVDATDITGNKQNYQLTVNEGTVTEEHTPYYGYYCDETGTETQFIQPASDLALINGKTINKLTFYVSSSQRNNNAVFQVRLKEITDTAFEEGNGLKDLTDAVMVYEGMANPSDGKVVITLTTPYEYKGGNLLVDFKVVTNGTYAKTYFYGVTTDYYSAVCDYSYSRPYIKFLPKVSFDYTDTVFEIAQNYDVTITESKTDVIKVQVSWTLNDISASVTMKKIWDTETLTWVDVNSGNDNEASAESVDATFEFKNLSSVKIDATVEFKAETNITATATYKDNDEDGDGTILLDSKAINTEAQETDLKGKVVVAVPADTDYFKKLTADATDAKYGTYTVTIKTHSDN